MGNRTVLQLVGHGTCKVQSGSNCVSLSPRNGIFDTFTLLSILKLPDMIIHGCRFFWFRNKDKPAEHLHSCPKMYGITPHSFYHRPRTFHIDLIEVVDALDGELELEWLFAFGVGVCSSFQCFTVYRAEIVSYHLLVVVFRNQCRVMQGHNKLGVLVSRSPNPQLH